jgi:hypothetical protein
VIIAALIGGAACVFIIMLDAVRAQGRPFALARAFVAGAWALAWFAYGINITRFPQPGWPTLLALTIACAGSIAMVPAAWLSVSPGRRYTVGRRTSSLMMMLALISVLLVAWDITHLVERVAAFGWWNGLKAYRLDRITGTGAFWRPGLQVMRAIALATGALGFARWTIRRGGADLGLAGLGLIAAITSTGRWEVITYCVWLFLIAALSGNGSHGMRWQLRQAALIATLGLFFLGHSQMFGKNENAGVVVRSAADGALATQSIVPCQRWEAAKATSNANFNALPGMVAGVLLYLAGPFGAFDRVMCEGPEAVRQVIFYWPFKLARGAGLRPPETLLAVDPYVDIGVPFNNYTVIHPFMVEIGPWLGCFVWLALAGAVRWGAGRLVQADHPALIVAAAAPLAMAVRTPWTNTFFDGTLVVWIAVAAISWWASSRDARARPSAS